MKLPMTWIAQNKDPALSQMSKNAHSKYSDTVLFYLFYFYFYVLIFYLFIFF
jgi:hypothetical protein